MGYLDHTVEPLAHLVESDGGIEFLHRLRRMAADGALDDGRDGGGAAEVLEGAPQAARREREGQADAPRDVLKRLVEHCTRAITAVPRGEQ
ncbi:hypothetical protein [Pendulispora albinea]|uniref:Uncharacterized protein n=1 Tax=Pendulispora albinea TaxID=2741071 RepID=A0ABZ2LPP3_9BACT